MSTLSSSSRSRSTQRAFPSASSSAKRPSEDLRMLAQQQMRLLSGMTRLLSRLLHSLLWEALGVSQRRRAQALLTRLEHDLQLTHLITQRPPAGASHPPVIKEHQCEPDEAPGSQSRRP